MLVVLMSLLHSMIMTMLIKWFGLSDDNGRTSCPTKPFCSDHLRFVMNREIKQCSNRAVVWKKLDFSSVAMPVQIRSFTRHKNKKFCKASFPSTPSFDDFVYVCSRTQEDVVNINQTPVRLGWLTANGREIY